jgi:hypothetical protein
MRYREFIFEMSNLSPKETGLDFVVFVSPKMGQHDVRIKVTLPPWGKNPEGIYTIRPFECVSGDDWLSTKQRNALLNWVNLNYNVIIDFWDGNIVYDDDLRTKIVNLKNKPPNNSDAAILTLREIAPKVTKIYWDKTIYHLYFDNFIPSVSNTTQRFIDKRFKENIDLHLTTNPTQGIELWVV